VKLFDRLAHGDVRRRRGATRPERIETRKHDSAVTCVSRFLASIRSGVSLLRRPTVESVTNATSKFVGRFE
jgi:hypothetical protein